MKFKTYRVIKNFTSKISFVLVVLFCLAGLVSVFYYKTTPKGQTILILVSAILFFLRLKEIINIDKLLSISKPVFWFGLFALIVSINLVLQKMQGYDLIGLDGRSSYWASMEIFVLGLIWFFCGASIQFLEFSKSNLRACLLIGIVFLLIYGSLNGGVVISYADLNAETISESQINHLTTGDNVVILLLIGYGFANKRLKLLVAPVILIILFSLGGRNALLTLIVGILIYHFLRGEVTNIFSILIPVLGVVIVIGFLFELNHINDDLVARMFFLDGLGSDASFVQRNRQIYESVINLTAQAPIGNASLIVRQQGVFGGYSHNILSVWQFFGLVPFAILFLMMIKTTKYMWFKLKKITLPLDEFAAILLIYSVLCVFISRAIGFPCFWLAMGYWMARSVKRQDGVNKKIIYS
ncbi:MULTISPECIES: hypothetical protein [unclassified Polaromonas]|uniref:hypothetical protein n=1 Tax=unclassified Polaromonas TaxID=2638319 RepID=UPI0018CA2337|nr:MULTISPECIES: hypothetical protein [unclassified Polaromonas]MBG6073082.1 hypothetical protein [Polaromonas sp. CG_9.7]MBG6115087.1 hypothetical protein [Polaromonas sp. CG_9.2]